MQYLYINNDQQLAQFCQDISGCDYLALDTEFIRTRTLYPKLALVQVCAKEQVALIDPLTIADFAPLKQLLVNPEVVKILHSCSEDLEAFWYNLEVIPTPIFDTQFAYGLLGYETMMGYGGLVQARLGLTLDKGESRTDWLARPLTEKQRQYACNDVLYLHQLYPALAQEVDAKDWRHWVFEEVAQLVVKKQAQLAPQYNYLLLKMAWQLSPKSLALLQLLCDWRVRLARERNSALNFIVKEALLMDIAKRLPQSRKALADMGMYGKDIRNHGDAILAMVEQVEAMAPADYPPQAVRLDRTDNYKNLLAEIRQICVDVAQEQGIPVEVLASKKQMNQYIKWRRLALEECKLQSLQPDLLAGWRGPLLANALEALDIPQLY